MVSLDKTREGKVVDLPLIKYVESMRQEIASCSGELKILSKNIDIISEKIGKNIDDYNKNKNRNLRESRELLLTIISQYQEKDEILIDALNIQTERKKIYENIIDKVIENIY